MNRDALGRRVAEPPRPEPPAPLLEMLRFIGRAAVRRVYNDPRTTVHVERLTLGWLMEWDPLNDTAVRQFIGLRAANEARRIKAMTEAERTAAFGRSSADAVRLTKRDHRPVRPN